MLWYIEHMSTTVVKVKNNTVTLPRKLERMWNNADVVVTTPPSGDTIILKRVEQKKGRVSEIAVRNPLPKMSRQAVNREITAYRSSH